MPLDEVRVRFGGLRFQKSLAASVRLRTRSALIDRHVGHIAWADVFSARPNQLIVRILLEDAATTGDLDAQANALLALLDADYVRHQLAERGETLETLGDAWESVARKLCGR